ncbi:hypothetical protein NA57DRAFT_59693 [Rhizodiscina lignyota]|uniref:Uncharacterized protein n=1 Tax=Rhizodiscina lignyota TaxID=1504668 RepID=A0A9P4M2I2_9PEZI|nr:hypothetical protein NA57DRAFT_59693 [Rhizodiscina lignyota]
MKSPASFFVLIALLCTSPLSALARILEPIRPNDPRHPGSSFTKRADQCDLDLMEKDSLYWGEHGSPPMANLTMYAQEHHIGVLNMETFIQRLDCVQCTNKTIAVRFKDRADIDCVLQAWDRVNGADNVSFVLFIGKGDCGWNSDRMPFIVSRFRYDEQESTAALIGDASDFRTVMQAYELYFSGVTTTNTDLARHNIFGDIFGDITSAIVGFGEGIASTAESIESVATSAVASVATSEVVPAVTNAATVAESIGKSDVVAPITSFVKSELSQVISFVTSAVSDAKVIVNQVGSGITRVVDADPLEGFGGGILTLNKTLFDSGDGVNVGVHCNDCGIHGGVGFNYHFAENLSGDIKEAADGFKNLNFKEGFKGVEDLAKALTAGTIRVRPENLSFTLSLSFNVTKYSPKGALIANPQFPPIPLDPYSIPGVADIGPELIFGLVLEMDHVSRSASIETGVTVSIDNASYVELDLFRPNTKPDFSGWVPKVEFHPPSVDARDFEAEIKIGLETSLVLAAQIGPKLGIDTGFDFVVPEVDHQFKTFQGSKETAVQKHQLNESNTECQYVNGSDLQKSTSDGYQWGLQVERNFAAEIDFSVRSKKDSTHPFVNFTLYRVESQSSETCGLIKKFDHQSLLSKFDNGTQLNSTSSSSLVKRHEPTNIFDIRRQDSMLTPCMLTGGSVGFMTHVFACCAKDGIPQHSRCVEGEMNNKVECCTPDPDVPHTHMPAGTVDFLI